MLIIFATAGILAGLIFLNLESLKQISETRQVENISYIASIYNDEQIELKDDKTYTNYLHDREVDSGNWYIKDNNLFLKSSSDYMNVDNNVLQIRDGVAFSDEYVSIPNLSLFKDFTGISKDIFVIGDTTPIFKISDSAYSSTSREYLISISKTNDSGSFERVGEYRCVLQQKSCSVVTIFSDADVALGGVYKKINTEVELALKSNKLDHLDVPLSSVNWRIWKSETGQLLGNMTYSSMDSLNTVGLIYNTNSKIINSKVDGFDLMRFDKVFRK